MKDTVIMKSAVRLAYLVADGKGKEQVAVALAKQVVSDWEAQGNNRSDVK